MFDLLKLVYKNCDIMSKEMRLDKISSKKWEAIIKK